MTQKQWNKIVLTIATIGMVIVIIWGFTSCNPLLWDGTKKRTPNAEVGR